MEGRNQNKVFQRRVYSKLYLHYIKQTKTFTHNLRLILVVGLKKILVSFSFEPIGRR